MSRVGVRSEALVAAARAVDLAADEVARQLRALLALVARSRPPPGPGAVAGPCLVTAWARVEARAARALGPAGLAGEALALEGLATRLRLVARAYEEVEAGVATVMRSVALASDLAARVGALAEPGARPVLRPVPATWSAPALAGPADLVAAGERLDGGRVRVVEVSAGAGRSAWVVVVPGTQSWSAAPGANPFDLTTDVRAVADAERTVAAAGVALALERARDASGRSAPDDPVLLVGHSQGGIIAAALASDPAFTAGQRVTHVLTTGAPVGLFPVPPSVRVLSVEHVDDPVPGLDLTPNPSRETWLTVRAGEGPPLDVRRHALQQYVETTRASARAPGGTVPGVAAWTASAGAFLGRRVRTVTDVALVREWQNPRP